jgi:predicted MPP superfamily phosphohydrolase
MELAVFWLRALLLLVYLVAGWCVFLYLLNRYLSQLRKVSPKFLLIVVSFVVVNTVALYLATRARSGWWLIPPALIIGIAVLGETRRRLIRRGEIGSGPVREEGPGLSLLRPITTADAKLVFYEIAMPEWRGPDFRIAHISDLHLDDHLPVAYYHEAIARACATNPDLVFFTGDFISKDQAMELVPEVINGIRGRCGTFAILGNHDYWVDGAAVAEAVRATGITLLGDGCERVVFAGGATLFICGCESRWSGPNLALPRPAPGEVGLILSHTADHIEALAGAEYGVAAVFSGHYHAGQLRLPGVGSLVVPSNHGRRFDHGHFMVNGTHLFVTAGLGAEVPPVRIYCQPDIFIVDVKGAGADVYEGARPRHRG